MKSKKLPITANVEALARKIAGLTPNEYAAQQAIAYYALPKDAKERKGAARPYTQIIGISDPLEKPVKSSARTSTRMPPWRTAFRPGWVTIVPIFTVPKSPGARAIRVLQSPLRLEPGRKFLLGAEVKVRGFLCRVTGFGYELGVPVVHLRPAA